MEDILRIPQICIKYKEQPASNYIPTQPTITMDGVDFATVKRLTIDMKSEDFGKAEVKVEFLPVIVEQRILVKNTRRLVELDGVMYELVPFVE